MDTTPRITPITGRIPRPEERGNHAPQLSQPAYISPKQGKLLSEAANEYIADKKRLIVGKIGRRYTLRQRLLVATPVCQIATWTSLLQQWYRADISPSLLS